MDIIDVFPRNKEDVKSAKELTIPLGVARTSSVRHIVNALRSKGVPIFVQTATATG